MKKRIIAAVMATLVGLSMVGCGSTSSDNSSQNKTDNTDSTAQAETSDGEKNPVTIRFYNYALSETAKADWWENTIANFEKENDWIDIETVTVDYNSIVSTFTNDIASGLSVDMSCIGNLLLLPGDSGTCRSRIYTAAFTGVKQGFL